MTVFAFHMLDPLYHGPHALEKFHGLRPSSVIKVRKLSIKEALAYSQSIGMKMLSLAVLKFI